MMMNTFLPQTAGMSTTNDMEHIQMQTPSFSKPVHPLLQEKQPSLSTLPLFDLEFETTPLESPLEPALEFVDQDVNQDSPPLASSPFTPTSTGQLTDPNSLKTSSSVTLGVSSVPKMKASCFPATKIQIGSWERNSIFPGDLVCKFYYAKKQIIWEMMEQGLKSKMEILFQDVTGLYCAGSISETSYLIIEVSKPPKFFREVNPQPKKNIVWAITSDFTAGQASVCKKHMVTFPKGVLQKHFEKLISSDPKLKQISESGISSEEYFSQEL